MQAELVNLLRQAQASGYAVGAFNVYNLEGVLAVVSAAEAECSPVILQLHPSALKFGGPALLSACLTAARYASIPALVHLDHSSSSAEIEMALKEGVKSIMADGSHFSYSENVRFTREMALLAHEQGAAIEAELGRLTGNEDGLTVSEYEARLTDPEQAAEFVAQTGIDALAVCIGNVHGRYAGEPKLDFDRMEAIKAVVDAPLVLHGTSGLPNGMISRAIDCGAHKFNVNTEVREAYLAALTSYLGAGAAPDLIAGMTAAIVAMQAVVRSRMVEFRSIGRA